MPTNKKKIGLYVDRNTWNELNEILQRKGYPRGVPSWLAQQAFETTILQLSNDAETQLDLFFDRNK